MPPTRRKFRVRGRGLAQLGPTSRMRNHTERALAHCLQRKRASRKRVPPRVTATWSTRSCLPSQRGHTSELACASTTAALGTVSGRSGAPPSSSSNKRSRACASLEPARSATRRTLRSRGFLAIALWPSVALIWHEDRRSRIDSTDAGLVRRAWAAMLTELHV